MIHSFRLFGIALMAVVLSLGFASCGGGGSDDDNNSTGGGTSGGSTVTSSAETVSTTNVESMQATINGRVTASTPPGTLNIGAVVSTRTQPTVTDCEFNVHPASVTGKDFAVTVTGLRPSTTYYCRAYYYDGTSIVYGKALSFTTKSSSIASVDLGLSSGTIWSATNVGADNPLQIGYYFAWGETQPIGTLRSSLSDNIMRNVGEINGNPIGDLSENLLKVDPAYVYFGKDWRTPSQSQFEELRKECNWQWCDGVNVKYQGSTMRGYIVSSKVNSNSIFLPATGYYEGTRLVNTNNGYYRPRLEQQTPPEKGIALYFNDQGVSTTSRQQTDGCVIRPVKAFDL